MPLPGDVNTTTVTGTFTDAAGNPVGGSITFTPSTALSNTAGMLIIPAVGREYFLQGGKFTSDPLAATDNSVLQPAGWTYLVRVTIENVYPPLDFQAFLPSSPSTVDFSDLQPVYPVAGYAEFLALSGGTLTGPLYASEAPQQAMEVATKAYVDAVSQGLSQKPSVQEAALSALPSNTYTPGVLTATSNGALTVDGVVVAAGDRVLVKNEGTASHNGIYLVSSTGSVSAPYVLTRASDMNTAGQVPGAYTLVEQGTQAGTGWMVASPGPFTLGTTPITWAEFGAGAVVAGTGLSKSGNTLSLTAPVTVALGGTSATTAAAALASLGAPALAGDLGGTSASPQVTGTHLASALPVNQGGTGSTSQNWTGLLTPTSVQTANANALAGQIVLTNTTSGSVTITLPNAPANLTIAGVKQVQQASMNTTTVACAGSDVFNYAGSGSTTAVLRLQAQGVIMQYQAGSPGVWVVVGDDLPLTQLDSRYLTVAGEPVTVAQGGTGDTSLTAYAVLAGGITSTGALQQVSGVGSATQVLTSNGAAALPTWQNSASGVTLDTTATDIQPDGTQSAGSAGKAADAGHAHPALSGWAPADVGLLVATTDPAVTNTQILTAGTVYLIKLPVRQAMTISYTWWYLGTAASGTSTQSFTGLYSSAGTLLTGSPDIGSALSAGAGNLVKLTLTTPQALSAGTFVWAAILVNMGTTQPTLGKNNGVIGVFNAGTTAAAGNLRAANYPTLSQTALPGSVTPTALGTGNAFPFWAGASAV